MIYNSDLTELTVSGETVALEEGVYSYEVDKVFGVDGKLIATSTLVETILPSAGIYLVNVTGNTYKVVAY